MSLLVGGLVGCGSGVDSSAGPGESSNLRVLSRLYVKYQASNQGVAPPDETAFKAFIQQTGQPILEAEHVADIAGLFISERDGEPYVIKYGSDKNSTIDHSVIGYERSGKDGTRVTCFDFGVLEALGEVEFNELVHP